MDGDGGNVNEVIDRINRLFEADKQAKLSAAPLVGEVKHTSPLRTRILSPPSIQQIDQPLEQQMDFERRTAVSTQYPVRGPSSLVEKEAEELRRQESLRQQIASKEQQLAKMRNTTQQLRMRLVGRDEDQVMRPELENRGPRDNALRRTSPLRGNFVGKSDILADGRIGTAEGPRSYGGPRSPEPGNVPEQIREIPDPSFNEFARATNNESPLNIQQFLSAAKSTGKFKGERENPYNQQMPLRTKTRSRSNSRSVSKERTAGEGGHQRLKPYNYQTEIPEKPANFWGSNATNALQGRDRSRETRDTLNYDRNQRTIDSDLGPQQIQERAARLKTIQITQGAREAPVGHPTSPLRQKQRSQERPAMLMAHDRSYEDDRSLEDARLLEGHRMAAARAEQANSRMPPHALSPLRERFGNTLGGLRASGNLTAALRQEKIQTLFIDTASLQKRLLIVQSELDRVVQDKQALLAELDTIAARNRDTEAQVGVKTHHHDMANADLERELQANRIVNVQLSQEVEAENQSRKQVTDKMGIHQGTAEQERTLQERLTRELQENAEKHHKLDLMNMEAKHKLEMAETQLSEQALELENGEQLRLVLEGSVQSVLAQRQDVLEQLERQNHDHDVMRHEIETARATMINSNNQERRLLATKILFNNLELFIFNRRLVTLQEIALFAKFDKKCHHALRRLAKVMEDQGRYGLRKALEQWYDNALRPRKAAVQNKNLVYRYRETRVKKIAFQALVEQFQSSRDRREMRRSALESFFYILGRGNTKELRRGMFIWKSLLSYEDSKTKRLRRIVRKCDRAIKHDILLTWQKRSRELDEGCRLELLKREYVQNLMLTSLQGNLRVQTAFSRKKRLLAQGLVFKAWRDYLAKKDFDMTSNMLSLRFVQANRQQTLAGCFQALRHSKQTRKARIIKEALEEDMNFSLDQTTAFLHACSTQLQLRYRKQALVTITTMLSKNLFGYFQKWRTVTRCHKAYLVTKLNDRVVRHYKAYMESYFINWKALKDRTMRGKRGRIVSELEGHYDEIHREVVANDKKLREAWAALRTDQRKKMATTVKKFTSRQLGVAWAKWFAAMQLQRLKENRAGMILMFMRQNMVQQFFDKYKYNVGFMGRIDVQNVRVDKLIWRFQKRTLHQQFIAWCAFTHNSRESKRGLARIMNRLFHKKMYRHYRRWHYGATNKYQEKLRWEQNSTSDKMVLKNQVLGEYLQLDEFQKNELLQTHGLAAKNGRKLLYNYLARFYMSETKKNFRKWKLLHWKQLQKDRTLLRLMQHRKKQAFDQTVAALRQHAAAQRKHERRAQIRTTEIQVGEEAQLILHDKHLQQERAEVLVRRMDKVSKGALSTLEPKAAKRLLQELPPSQIDIQSTKIRKTVDILISKNMDLTMKSKKRAVFEGWRRVTQLETRFHSLVFKVFERSLYDVGFVAIRQASKSNRRDFLIEKIIGKHYKKIYRSWLAEAICIWKEQLVKDVVAKTSVVTGEYEQTAGAIATKEVNIKDQNVKNCLHHFVKMRKQKLLDAWQLTRYNRYMKETLAGESKDVLAVVHQKRYLQKWFLRTKVTQRFRCKWAQFKQRQAFRLKLKVWEVFQFKQNVNNTMAIVVSNLENFMRTKILDDSLKNIVSFAKSKILATSVFKRRATWDIYSLLCQRHIKVMRRRFHQLKFKVTNELQRKARAHIIFGKINAQRRHRAFRRWRECLEKELQVEELNATGPVTEYVFEAQRLMFNLKLFMKEEGFTAEQVKEWAQHAHDTELAKIRKGGLRWMMWGKPNSKLLIKAFDHLKMMVEFRKIMRHWLIFSNNRVQWVKADMMEAFGKWRQGDVQIAVNLERQPLEYLRRKNIKQSNDLIRMANEEAENDTVLKHLSLQRDELLEHYVRAQKLALALCTNNLTKAKGKRFNVWRMLLKENHRDESQQEVMTVVEDLTTIKEKARAIERENDTLAKENEELRQFSMDGFKIAQNVNTLSAEREKLTCDLADQADMIRDLLEENKRLQSALDGIRNNQGAPASDIATQAGKHRIKTIPKQAQN